MFFHHIDDISNIAENINIEKQKYFRNNYSWVFSNSKVYIETKILSAIYVRWFKEIAARQDAYQEMNLWNLF